MAEQVYDKAALRKKCVDALRRTGGPMSTGMVAMAVGAQMWAVDHALEDAYQNKEATFAAGVGWVATPEAPARPAPSADAQTDLVG
ncbi:MAG: hypothetical protein V4451_04800 [Pseudomonadota bacterium]